MIKNALTIQQISKILLLVLISILFSCKQNKVSNLDNEYSKNITEKIKVKDNSGYKEWCFSSQNIDKTYGNIKIYISNDSIKVMNLNSLKCKGEIVQEKSTFTSYFKSKKTGADIKEKLKKDYGLNAANDDIIVVMNAYGDLSKEGCLFPFGDMFIIDNHLFYYDKGYHCFVPNNDKISVTENKADNYLKESNIQLPYNKKIDIDNVTYNKVGVTLIKGLEDFSCGQEDVRYLSLPSKNDVKFILVPQDCADFPYRFYLLTIKDNKIVSNLYVEGESFEPENIDNKSITNFQIDEKQVIHVKTIEKVKDKTKSELVVNYEVNELGKIIKN
ncbi:hypothetical protein AR687_20485 [Flavobacteriaceae bacterium CRH]|nr:hypothetical protein AR687_20485 [Flavobacteriaceae bacterium CRH]